MIRIEGEEEWEINGNQRYRVLTRPFISKGMRFLRHIGVLSTYYAYKLDKENDKFDD